MADPHRYNRFQPLKTVIFFCIFITLAPHSITNAGSAVAELNLPAISIIIDDLGYTYKRDMRVANLAAPVTCAILPHTPYGVMVAEQAHRRNKEILLHQPMQANDNWDDLGPGAVNLDMNSAQFQQVIRDNLDSIPYVTGMNNHMGSLLTRHPGHMSWLMEILEQREDLFLIDSFTTSASVVGQIANEYWIPNIRRDIFLDNVRTIEHISAQFDKLLATARQNGYALAIGHPYPQTIAVLENLLPKLTEKGYHVVPVSTLLKIKNRKIKTWRAFLSP